MTSPDPNPSKFSVVHLDGRTLEGGGQLVRNAVALSALTGQPVAIHHIRGNRQGKKGLKMSHLAGVNLLAQVSESEVTGAEVGSSFLRFSPSSVKQGLSDGIDGEERFIDARSQRLLRPKPIQQEYNVRLSTAGSVFLVFQALYPYILCAGAFQRRQIRLNLTGGTNVSFSPSYDYVAQVLIPNFARLGLPRLEVQLRKRGWATGPVDLGAVAFVVDPLDLHGRTVENDETEGDTNPETLRGSESPRFPSVDMNEHQRGAITKIDITVLAPDNLVHSAGEGNERGKGDRHGGTQEGQSRTLNTDGGTGSTPDTARQLLRSETIALLREKLSQLPSSLFEPKPASDGKCDDTVPITIHTSEQTSHFSHMYVLIVAHISSGFRLGRDALFGTHRSEVVHPRRKKGAKHGESMENRIRKLARRCVDEFIDEITGSASGSRKACVDMHMRDQVVVFEALGRLDHCDRGKGRSFSGEDEMDWSLHTKTARWVCEEVLGVKW